MSDSNSKPINALELPASTENPFPQKFHEKMGESHVRGLSDAFGLAAFGANLEVLLPGGSSGLKHWHSKSEEFVYVISGELTLYYGDREYAMEAGSCMGFKANEQKGHRLVNNTDQAASFLVVGSRVDNDKAVYDEDDVQWLIQENGDWVAATKSGNPY